MVAHSHSLNDDESIPDTVPFMTNHQEDFTWNKHSVIIIYSNVKSE